MQKTKSNYRIKREKQIIDNMTKYPVTFHTSKKDRYQINLHRLYIPDALLFPTWLQSIYLEIGLDPFKYVRRKVFRIEKGDKQNIYKLCLSYKNNKNSSVYGTNAIVDFNKGIVDVETTGSCGWYNSKKVIVDKKDLDFLLQNIFDLLKDNSIDYDVFPKYSN